MKKRILGAALAFALALCPASGCGKNSENPPNNGTNDDPPAKEFVWNNEKSLDETLQLASGASETVTVSLEMGEDNYVGLDLKTDVNLVGKFTFENASDASESFEEEFFVSADTDGEFRQITDFYFAHVYGKKMVSVTFKNVSEKEGTAVVRKALSGEKEWFESSQVFLEKGDVKLGIDMNAGGSINYLEYLRHNVQQVKTPLGSVEVGVNYEDSTGGTLMYDSVNLINEMDRGRLVQQSYYGISKKPYECAQYIGTAWPYNPVQGGDYTGTSSRIVDFEITKDSVYIKVRPLDWAKVESITPSYMENRYTIGDDGVVKAENVFTDWSGYNHDSYRDQELPAFYGIISLGTMVTYRGDKPFTGEEANWYPQLGNWVGSSRAYWTDITENWVAWVNDDDFGVGLYTPDASTILTGKVGSKNNQSGRMCKADATTYTAMIARMSLNTYESFSYDYYLAVGQVQNMRKTFNNMAKTCKNEDITEWSGRK